MRRPYVTVQPMPAWMAVVVVAMAVVSPTAAVAQRPDHGRGAPIAALDAYVAGAVRDWRVPGLAIAVVHGDTIVLAKGYGVRRVGRPEPVDAHTVFAIGSTTKAMTATLMAMLVDSGRAGWDDPVIDHLPEFRVQDPYVTREMTIRDLLTHRGGLPETDFLWEDTTTTFAEILRRLQYVSPAYSMRSEFVYQNVMYATAGHIEANLTGTTWDDLIRRRLFGPLDMTDTKTSTHQLDSTGDVATPHARVHDTLLAIPWHNLDGIAPAGSVNSSVADMARWIRFVLDSDRVGGNRLVSAAAFREMFTPQVVVPLDFYPAWKDVGQPVVTYGFAWFLFEYRGHRVAMHTGSIDGMSAIVGLLPDDRVGVVVLVNEDHAELRHALLLRTFDTYLGGTNRDWSTDLRRLYDSLDRQADSAQRAEDAARVPGVTPALPLDRYVGTYRDSLYGTFVVRLDGSSLVGRLGSLLGDMEPWGYDAFRFRARDWTRATVLITCVLTPAGRVSELRFADGRHYEGVADP
jgi:CubicO group peptidase (beta-lactamase class C family)